MPQRCRFCKQVPLVDTFGKNWEVYCNSDTRDCEYPPSVTAETYEGAVKKWDSQFGLEEFLNA